MESQTGSVIPGIISKQELLFAGTMIEITNMVELTANAFNIFGKNIKTIKDRIISYKLYDITCMTQNAKLLPISTSNTVYFC